MSRIHQDELRFTKDYLENEIFPIFSQVKIYPIGNFYTIILDILRGKIQNIKFAFLRYLSYLPYLFLFQKYQRMKIIFQGILS